MSLDLFCRVRIYFCNILWVKRTIYNTGWPIRLFPRLWFSIWSMYWNTTIVLMPTKPWEQPEWSPLRAAILKYKGNGTSHVAESWLAFIPLPTVSYFCCYFCGFCCVDSSTATRHVQKCRAFKLQPMPDLLARKNRSDSYFSIIYDFLLNVLIAQLMPIMRDHTVDL